MPPAEWMLEEGGECDATFDVAAFEANLQRMREMKPKWAQTPPVVKVDRSNDDPIR